MSTNLGTNRPALNHSTRNGPTPSQRAAIDEHLSESHQEMLSLPAQIVYCTVLQLLKYRNAQSIWMNDAEISRRSRVLIQFIPGAQTELARAGLLFLTPGEKQVRYELITENDAYSSLGQHSDEL
jgi:hypothetical protein